MTALLKKDGLLLLVLLLAGVAGLTAALEDPGYVRLWVFPPQRLEAPFHVMWALGLLLGLAVGLRDEVLQTHEFLHHRPVAPARIHAARVLGCGLVLAGWLLLPPVAHWLLQAAFGDYAPLHQWHHATALWTVQVPGLTACALGLWIGRLPLPPIPRILLGGAAWLAAFSLLHEFARTSRADALAIDPTRWIGGHLLATVALLASSFVGAGRRTDPDRPWPGPLRLAFGLPAAAALTIAASYLLGALQENHASALARTQPAIVRHGDGHLLVTRREEGGSTVFRVVDDQHRPIGPLPPGVDGARELWANHGRLGREPDLEAPRLGRHSSGGNWRSQAQVGSDGVLYVLRRSMRSGADAQLLRLRRPDGTPLAEGTSVLWTHDNTDAVWLAEPDAAEVWLLADAAEVLTAVPLPDGDRTHRQWQVYWTPGDGGFVLGQTGTWQIHGRELRPAPAPVEQFANRDRDSQRVRSSGDDPLQPTVQVLGADGQIAFEHAFTVRTGAERWHLGLTLAWSLLRAPGLQAWSHLRPADGIGTAPALDALVAHGQRSWLVLGSLGLALLCAFGARRHLRRIGADVPAQRVWFTTITLLGPAGLAAMLLIETRRAHASFPAGVARDPDRTAPPRIAAAELQQPVG